MADTGEIVEAEQTGQTRAVDESKVDYSKMAALDGVDSVLIKQPLRNKEIIVEMMLGYEMVNLYTIQSVNEESKEIQQLFTLKEQSNCCLRQWYIII